MTTTDRIWIGIGVLILVLTVAGAVSVLAATPEEYYEQARDALNRAEFKTAAELYAQAYEANRDSDLAGDALYWQSFSLYRLGRTSSLKRAVDLLEMQAEHYSEASTYGDGMELSARIHGELARLGDERSARRIRQYADEGGADETKLAALQALMMMDEERALPILKKIIEDRDGSDVDLRGHALMILGQIHSDETEEILIGALHGEDDPELLSGVIMWLSMQGSDRSLDAIMELARDCEDKEVCDVAIFALGQHGGRRAVTCLKEIAVDEDADPELRGQALFGLSQTGDEGVADIMVAILRNSEDLELQEMALFSLSQLGGEVSADVFLELIRNENADDELRAQALHFAATNGGVDVGFVREVYDAAEDEDLRSQCCWVLSDMGTDEALSTLIDIVRNEKNEDVRQQAVFWVGQFGSDKAADFLLELILEG